MPEAFIDSKRTHVLPLELARRMPVIVRGDGVWVEDAAGRRYLDAMSGGSMAATLGHGRRDIIAAANAQADRLAYVHNERLTNPAQERLATELLEVAPEGFTRARFTVAGSDANEMAIQLARSYHVERGEPERWQVISPAQSYHGPTMETLALTGRAGLHGPFGPYLPHHLHIPPSTWRFDPTGETALHALDRAIEEAGPGTVSAFFCEPISGAALPAYTPPVRFWEGLAERRERHGFLVCFDEIVTGLGRTGDWFAGAATACTPDIIATAKGLGAGYAAIGAVLVREHVYEAIASGSRRFPLGHTWDGAPLPCAVGLAVLHALRSEGLVDRVRDRGPRLRDELAAAVADTPIVHEVRGRGFLLGIEFVDPRDGRSFLPRELGVACRIDEAAFERGLITLSTQPTRDGYAGDQTLFAPPFVTNDEELVEMVARLADAVHHVSHAVEAELPSAPLPPSPLRRTSSSREGDAQAVPVRALILQHEEPTPPGLVIEWLGSHGASAETFRVDIDEREVHATEYDLIVSLGSEFAAFDDSKPFVTREAQLMRDAVDADIPVLGLCFGGQMLARVLGGEVYRSDDAEIGWLPVRSKDPSLVPDGPWFQWHFDTFTPPPAAEVVADSPVGPQAFVAGRSLGLQFHPEVTTEIMDDWVRIYRHELDADGVDPDALLDETRRLAVEARRMSWQLLEGFWSEVAKLDRGEGTQDDAGN